MTYRTVIYDTGMLLALLAGRPAALVLHQALRIAPHRPVIIGPVLAQAWRPDPKTVYAISQYLKDCTVPQTRGAASPIRGATTGHAGCVACAKTFTLESYKRAGAMIGKAALPSRTQPDAMVVVAAALHAPAQVLTSDPGDIAAYAATLDRADITVERI